MPAEEDVLDLFASTADALLASGDLHAVGIAVSAGDSVIGTVTLGARPDGTPLDSTSPFRIASVSKVFTAVVVMQLVEEGRLHLDDRLADLWPDALVGPDPRVGAVTIRQLLHHTSGFGVLRDQFFGDAATEWHTAAKVAMASVLEADPGTRYRYSNANFVILGSLVELATGSSIEQLVTDRVLTPHGVGSASLLTTNSPLDPSGPAYVVGPARRYLAALGPAGAWALDPADLARVMAGLQPGSRLPLVAPGSLEEMRTSHGLIDTEPGFDYGLGLMLFPLWYGHTGTIEDARAFAIDLPNGYTVTVLAATSRISGGEELIDAFAAPVVRLYALAPVG